MECWFEERQRLLKEFNIRALGVRAKKKEKKPSVLIVGSVAVALWEEGAWGLRLRCGLCGPPRFSGSEMEMETSPPLVSFCAADTSSDKPLGSIGVCLYSVCA